MRSKSKKKIYDIHVMDRVVVTNRKNGDRKKGVVLQIYYDRSIKKIKMCVYAEAMAEYKGEEMPWYVSFACELKDYHDIDRIDGFSNSDYVLIADDDIQLNLF